MKKKILAIITGFLPLLFISGQETPVEKGLQHITREALNAQLGFLASDWTEGRMTGEKGAYLSSDYIASMLQLYGVEPYGDMTPYRSSENGNIIFKRSYFQNFRLLKIMPGEKQVARLRSVDGESSKIFNLTYNVDFLVSPDDPALEIEAPVVFAGYCITVKDKQFINQNKQAVKGKFVLKISGFPEHMLSSHSVSELRAIDAEIVSNLKDLGAIGIIEFDPDITLVGNPDPKDFSNMSPAEERPYPNILNTRYLLPQQRNRDNLVRLEISARVANEILKGTSVNLDEYIDNADSVDGSSLYLLPGKYFFLKTSIKTSQITARNVIGIIEGKNPDEIIVLGAHFDHMGMNNGYIWNGADDNASGTTGVLTLARAITGTDVIPDKTIIVALWSAEEEGLLGSRYFVRNAGSLLKKIRLNVNFDMISRYVSEQEQNKVTMTYSSSCPEFREITMSNLKKHNIDLDVVYEPSPDPPGGTDHRSFVEAGIPVMRFKPGHREEYHTPADETDTVDWDIMEKIVRISFTNVWELAGGSW